MRPYGFLLVLMGPNRFLSFLMDFNGFLCSLIGLYVSLYVLMGPNGSS